MEKVFIDEKDFQINPILLKQIDFENCHETTPEGKALWVYIRLCQLLKYDEGYFFHNTCYNMNYNHKDSFDIVEQVTTETPTTCFNFSRIAVKLLNQIPEVQANILSVGDNLGHFRFVFQTDRVIVKAEPTTPTQHLTDMGRAKLGLKPQGLQAEKGGDLIQELMLSLTNKMLLRTRRNLREYIGCLQQLPNTPKEPQIELETLVTASKKYGVDGNSMVQMLLNINHQFVQQPYQLMRMGILDGKNQIYPQLLVREKTSLKRIDLMAMEVSPLQVAEYNKGMKYGYMVHTDNYEPTHPGFFQGMENNGREM